MTPRKAATIPLPDLTAERQLSGLICGVDEVGRGPLAGPVFAAAVVLDPGRIPAGIADSKLLAEDVRERIYAELMDVAKIGIGSASVAEIDELNILWASMLAMKRAVEALPVRPDHALIDGNRAPRVDCPCTPIIRGDAKSLSIAAASIVAKVTRDRVMVALAAEHEGYGWATNKGYGTPEHCAALERLGITAHHRLSFAPVYRLKTQHIDITH